MKTRTLEARQPLAPSPTELQTQSCRVDNFLSDDESIAVLEILKSGLVGLIRQQKPYDYLGN